MSSFACHVFFSKLHYHTFILDYRMTQALVHPVLERRDRVCLLDRQKGKERKLLQIQLVGLSSDPFQVKPNIYFFK